MVKDCLHRTGVAPVSNFLGKAIPPESVFFRNAFALQACEFLFGSKRVRRGRAGMSAEESLSEE